MPAYNFKKQFAKLVKTKRKRQTVRALRKDKWLPRTGMTAYCYTGMRTKDCELLGEFKIKEVCKIIIRQKHVEITDHTNARQIDLIDYSSRNEFAKKDGFDNWDQFYCFFYMEHGIPFEGALIKW